MTDLLKYIGHVLINIIDKVGPTFATLVVVYLAYRYARKQKVFENKDEEYKKVRIVISNLIQIWRELARIEYYNSADDYYAKLIFKNVDFASNYFGIDIKRIENFKKLLEQSKEEIKPLNVFLFDAVESNFSRVNKSLDLFSSSENINFEKNLNDLLHGAFKDLTRDLESIIFDSAKYLPVSERQQIENIIRTHQTGLKTTNFNDEVPGFLVDWVNNCLPVIDSITSEELNIIINDDVVKMAIAKLISLCGSFLIKDNAISTLSNLNDLLKNPSTVHNLDFDNLICKIQITATENSMLQNNLAFYKICCAIHKKFKREIPFEFKRICIKLNNGTIDLAKELELHKINRSSGNQIV